VSGRAPRGPRGVGPMAPAQLYTAPTYIPHTAPHHTARRFNLVVDGSTGGERDRESTSEDARLRQVVVTTPADHQVGRRGSVQRCKSCESRLKGFRVGDRSRGRFATPADFPLHDCNPYRGLRVRRWGMGFVHRSRTNSLSGLVLWSTCSSMYVWKPKLSWGWERVLEMLQSDARRRLCLLPG
jgi:hypothetical protein